MAGKKLTDIVRHLKKVPLEVWEKRHFGTNPSFSTYVVCTGDRSQNIYVAKKTCESEECPRSYIGGNEECKPLFILMIEEKSFYGSHGSPIEELYIGLLRNKKEIRSQSVPKEGGFPF